MALTKAKAMWSPQSAAAVVSLCLLALLVGGYALGKPIDHDEHQFIASGVLLARDGLLPYLDYPYFHLPNLIFLYALAFSISPYLLLSARILSSMASVGTGTILLGFAYIRFRHHGPSWQIGAALLALLALVFNPVYRYTTGLAWNHDVPTFFFLLGLGLGAAQTGRAKRTWLMMLSGLCLGIAAGSRATYLLALPFAVAFLVAEAAHGNWRRRLCSLLIGAGVGLMPSVLLFLIDPKAFLFGNIGYAGLNTQFRVDRGLQIAMDLRGKLVYFARLLSEPAYLLVVLLAGILLLLLTAPRRGPVPIRWRAFALAAVPLALLVGGLLPTPSWPAYFYAPIPLTIFFVLWALPPVLDVRSRAVKPVLVLCLTLLAAAGLGSIRSGSFLPAFPQGLVPLRTHWVGERVGVGAGSAVVVTDSPIFPLEGGARIEPFLATGPFAIRVSYLLSPEDRARFHILDREAIEREVRERSNIAVLGSKGGLGLGQMAEELGFRAVEVGADFRLWVPQAAETSP
jgi:hypothetical protein